jgi:hypothetical protein
MEFGDREFEQAIEELLQAQSLSFKGIRLKCRECGDSALAGSVSLAESFGWIELKQIQGPNYQALCLNCAKRRS